MATIFKSKASYMAAVLLYGTSGLAWPQEILRTLQHNYWPEGAEYPPRLDLLEDHDGDGLGEFIIGDAIFHTRSPEVSGKVSVISSISGLETRAFTDGTSGMGWDATCLGDLDGDSVGDFGAASPNAPHGGIWIWSGRDLSLLHRDNWPSGTIATVGDVNGDGLQDVAHLKNGIRVIAGGSFEELYVALPDRPAPFLGWCIVSLGDVNGDQIPDFAASAPYDTNPLCCLECLQAWIFVFSGKDGTQLYRIQGTPPCDYLGYGMAAPGDLNSDGIVDLAANTEFRCIRFFDGKNGELLGETCDEPQPPFFGYFGRVIEAVGDINGNGYGDVLAWRVNYDELPPRLRQGEAWLIDGGTREFLYRFTNPRSISTQRYFGYGLASTNCGDWNEDGQPDLAIAAPGNPDRYSGVIDIYSGFPLGVRAVGQCPARPDARIKPRIGVSGIPILGRELPIHLSLVPAGTRALLLVRAGFLKVSRPGIACGLLSLPDQVIPATAIQVGDKEGAATAIVKIGHDPALIGQRLYAQWVVLRGRDPASSSRMLEITIQASAPPPYVP